MGAPARLLFSCFTEEVTSGRNYGYVTLYMTSLTRNMESDTSLGSAVENILDCLTQQSSPLINFGRLEWDSLLLWLIIRALTEVKTISFIAIWKTALLDLWTFQPFFFCLQKRKGLLFMVPGGTKKIHSYKNIPRFEAFSIQEY